MHVLFPLHISCDNLIFLGLTVCQTVEAGENVEPTHVEEIALQSPLVQQIIVVGQVWTALSHH